MENYNLVPAGKTNILRNPLCGLSLKKLQARIRKHHFVDNLHSLGAVALAPARDSVVLPCAQRQMPIEVPGRQYS
jgi:hypothetical protein